MTVMIPFKDGQRGLDWLALTDALAAGHTLPKAEVEDVFLYRGNNTLLNRSAWIKGMGIAVKCATVFPDNKAVDKPMIGGAVNLFSDDDGALVAILDFHLVTKWKTAGDSLLAARKLARPDSRNILIVGAGTVGAGGGVAAALRQQRQVDTVRPQKIECLQRDVMHEGRRKT